MTNCLILHLYDDSQTQTQIIQSVSHKYTHDILAFYFNVCVLWEPNGIMLCDIFTHFLLLAHCPRKDIV